MRNTKPSNLDRYKLGIDDDSSCASSRAGTYSVNFNSDMSQKNMNADLTNPNFYHSIEPNSEHVYDEIKQSVGYKDLGKIYLSILISLTLSLLKYLIKSFMYFIHAYKRLKYLINMIIL